jgi:protein O-mannosyl-transferase
LIYRRRALAGCYTRYYPAAPEALFRVLNEYGGTVTPRALRRPRNSAKKFHSRIHPQKGKPISLVVFGFLLFAGTLILYSPVREHDFINFDDAEYVVNNSHVKSGLTWDTLRWSVTSREQANWHPVTWWSHAADYELFGPDAGSQHIVNVIIHAANALLLFLLLNSATGASGASFVVAAMFAWHPFNVESVAWIAERKNVLCTFFFLSTLAVYGWFVHKPSAKRLTAVCGIFILALAAKPMAVTLPFVLLLLDYWPLRRVLGWTDRTDDSIPQRSFSQLLLEKIPLFLLTAAASVATVWAQSTDALRTTQAFPLYARLANALDSYVVYLAKTFWPFGFGLFYPHPGSSISIWKPVFAAVLLLAIGISAWIKRTKLPFLIIGWLLFLGVLFPMIGAVQVGDQAMADRYAYLSTIGLFIMAVWGATKLLDKLRAGKRVRFGLATILLALLCFLTAQQISYWENSVSIWSHTLDVTGANALAERKLGLAFVAQGDSEKASAHFINAVSLDPADMGSHLNLGAYYAAHDRLPEAMEEFQTAVRLTNADKNLSAEDKERRCSALINLGFAYAILKDYPQALADLKAAGQTNSDLLDRAEKTVSRALANKPSQDASLKLALLLSAQGHREEAISGLQKTLDTDPEYSQVRDLLGFLSSIQE